MGLPGLSAFISEVLVLLGAWQTLSDDDGRSAPATAILTAGYMLWTYPAHLPRPAQREVHELAGHQTAARLFTLVPLAIIVVVLGFYPQADPRPAQRFARCT